MTVPRLGAMTMSITREAILTILPSLSNKGKTRAARRARKPTQDNWIKAPRGKWLKCSYAKCGFEWQYFGGHHWAECPACHCVTKVAVARRIIKSR